MQSMPSVQNVVENWSLLGASKGLGLAFSELVSTRHRGISLFLASRKINNFDFSKADFFDFYCEAILATKPDRIFYFAAGGTYGPFAKYFWKDHLWTLNVSFCFPAYLLNYFLKNNSDIKQIVFVGSEIAETKPDPNAAMYCAAKHALRGLVSSVALENPPFQVTLFSPGYMNTSLLPKNAWPRTQGLVREPNLEAENLLKQVLEDRSLRST